MNEETSKKHFYSLKEKGWYKDFPTYESWIKKREENYIDWEEEKEKQEAWNALGGWGKHKL